MEIAKNEYDKGHTCCCDVEPLQKCDIGSHEVEGKGARYQDRLGKRQVELPVFINRQNSYVDWSIVVRSPVRRMNWGCSEPPNAMELLKLHLSYCPMKSWIVSMRTILA